MKLDSLCELLGDQLKDLYSAESQLVKALPKIAKHASSESLKDAIENHLEETCGHVERLERIGKLLECKLTGYKCKGMQGLLEEGEEALKAQGPEAVLDAAIVANAQRVEHYEIAAYGSARAMAQLLGKDDVAALLEETLKEEKAADQKLTKIVESEVYPEIQDAEQEADDSKEMAAAGNGSRRSK